MSEQINSIISGSGSYIPTERVLNNDFLSNSLYTKTESRNYWEVQIDYQYFRKKIRLRRFKHFIYNLFTIERAIESAGIDKEKLDHSIAVSNCGERESVFEVN